jgi:site-specific DNA-methyltransferase (adenine-specific)
MELKLIKGDCLVEMDNLIKQGIKVDLILTDPPYELECHGGTNSAMAQRATKVRDEIDFISNGFDYDSCFNKFLQLQKVPNILIFCSNKQLSKTMMWFENKGLSVKCLVWNKTNPSVFVRGKGASWNPDCELSKKYKVKRFPFVSPKIKKHPTQKPLELIKEYIELHSFENETVLDCFMGSGTTGEASLSLNRNFIGIELNDDFFNIAKNRIEDSQNSIFTI